MLRLPGPYPAQTLKAKLQRRIRRIAQSTHLLRTPIAIAAVIAVIAAICLYTVRGLYAKSSGMFQGIYVEAIGATMDIVVFGIVIAAFDLVRRRRLEISQQIELIDDFKKWDSDEARHRIAGAIRRLNRLGRTAIDFRGIEISNFSFAGNDIKSIAGSTFYDGTWGTRGRADNVKLDKVDFGSVDCRNVTFSAFNPLSPAIEAVVFASLKNCTFTDANLSGACFRGASLMWSDEPPEDIVELVEMEDGQIASYQKYYGPFDGADLTGASFREVVFQYADFRGAENINHCEFLGSQGLVTCVFDNAEVKSRVLEAARGEM